MTPEPDGIGRGSATGQTGLIYRVGFEDLPRSRNHFSQNLAPRPLWPVGSKGSTGKIMRGMADRTFRSVSPNEEMTVTYPRVELHSRPAKDRPESGNQFPGFLTGDVARAVIDHPITVPGNQVAPEGHVFRAQFYPHVCRFERSAATGITKRIITENR